MIELNEPRLSRGSWEHGASYVSLETENMVTRVVKMSEWSFDRAIPFFPPVRSKAHKVIIPLEGWVAYVDSIVPAGYSYQVFGVRERVDISLGTPHVLLFGPAAVIQVTSFGPLEETELSAGGPFWRVFSKFTEADLRRAYEEKRARHRDEYTD